MVQYHINMKYEFLQTKTLRKINIRSFVIFTILFYIYSSGIASGKIYNFSFVIQGNAKGKIFLIIPFRIFYQASSSVNFIAENKGDYTIFRSSDIVGNGYVVRTLGFSGKSLALLVAGKDLEKINIFSKKIIKDLPYIAPGVSKHITSTTVNFFILDTPIVNTLNFERSQNGIHQNIINNIKMTRIKNSSEKLKINFNVYKILSEALKTFNHSFLPKNITLHDLIKSGKKEWKSSYLNFTDALIKSSRKAAKIFQRIKGFGQKEPFRVSYKIYFPDKKIIKIKGTASPDISIWQELRIKNFTRTIKIKKSDFSLISDIVKVSVKDRFNGGGFFISYLKLKK